MYIAVVTRCDDNNGFSIVWLETEVLCTAMRNRIQMYEQWRALHVLSTT